MSLKKAVWVDFSRLQLDVLVSQLYLAQNHFELHVISTSEVIQSLPKDLISSKKIKSTTILPTTSKLSSLWSTFRQIQKIDADYVILNDAQGNMVKWLCLMGLLLRCEFVGVHHNADKFVYGSFTQALIQLKVKKYFVLSSYILKNLQGKVRKELLFSSFYVDRTDYKVPEKVVVDYGQSQQQQLRIAIPGFVEFRRRDYLDLIANVTQSSEKLSPHIQFYVIGNAAQQDGQKLKNLIAENNLQNHFVFFDHFLPQNQMYDQIYSCDLIMTLIGPHNQYYELYKKYKISGSYSLSIIFNKPLLLHDSYSDEKEFEDWALFYKSQSLVHTLNQLLINKDTIDSIGKKMKNKFDQQLAQQEYKYCQFIKTGETSV